MSERYDNRRTMAQLLTGLKDLESRRGQLSARREIYRGALFMEPKVFFESVVGFYNCVDDLCEINAGKPIASSKDAVALAKNILRKCNTAVGTINKAADITKEHLNGAWINSCEGGNTTTDFIETAVAELKNLVTVSTHSAVNDMSIVVRKLLDALTTLTGAENANFNDMFAFAAVEADEAITNAQLKFYTTLMETCEQFNESIANCQKNIRENRIEQA